MEYHEHHNWRVIFPTGKIAGSSKDANATDSKNSPDTSMTRRFSQAEIDGLKDKLARLNLQREIYKINCRTCGSCHLNVISSTVLSDLTARIRHLRTLLQDLELPVVTSARSISPDSLREVTRNGH